MNNSNRSRSPSVVQQDASKVASPPSMLDGSVTISDGAQFQSTQPSYDSSFALDDYQAANYFQPTYTDFTGLQHSAQSGDGAINNLLPQQASGITSSGDQSNFQYNATGQGSNNVSPGDFSHQNLLANTQTTAFPAFEFSQSSDFDQSQSVDPSLLASFDPNSLDLLPSQPIANDDINSLDPMATVQAATSPPSNHFGQMAGRHSHTPSPNASPHTQHASLFQPISRPRAVSESLDPSSAMYPPGQNEWSNIGAYRGHRHTPSDAYSDISSHSNNASPYMPTLDSFDANGHSSPLLNATHDPMFNDALGLQQFSLNENQLQSQFNPSPGHSPHISPRLVPQQQPLPAFTLENNFGLNSNFRDTPMLQQQHGGLDIFSGASQENFSASHDSHNAGEMGHADTMSPPEINIYYAPPPSAPPNDSQETGHDQEALSPPMRSPSRNRTRAKSDPPYGSRPSSPSLVGRSRSPSLQPTATNSDSLLPTDSRGLGSRSSSPARGRNGSVSRGRSSSNSSDHREYILDLANPERTPSNGADKRQQKHPATFQCTLCPKRFTRAYNLRSHLRTHTDERPFVCTICGKAFARQHDRKRHEGLHSGEKKFVCRGSLTSGAQWGCGRRFARADALGRHFRSEAGRVCIKPLLDEEAAERQKAMLDEHAAKNPGGMAPPVIMPPVDMMGNFLPAAILQQYPVLAGIDWNALPQGPPGDEHYSGRGSFDASSGGEIYDDMSDADIDPFPDQGMGGNDMSGVSMQSTLAPHNMSMPTASTVAGRNQGYGTYSNRVGDYMSDFEGR